MTHAQGRSIVGRRWTRGAWLAAPTALALIAGTPATLLASEDADLPLRQVRLYRSGVGYFEHRGELSGDVNVRLTFDAEHINDVLKSLVVLTDGGSVGAIEYDSKAPLSRRLGSFGIDLSDNPSLPDLFARLRGAELRLRTTEGTVEGAILGVERRAVPMGQHDQIREVPTVNLVTDSGIRNVTISEVSTFEILDEQLASEMQEALAAIASARKERSAAVDIALDGNGARSAAIGYIHEMPVWKTTYRLVLPEATGAEPRIQGWAIVENTTDQDWNDVQLSLSAGSPVGFTMDLHEPLFIERPEMPVPYAVARAPREYEQESPPAELARRRFSAKSEAARQQAPASADAVSSGSAFGAESSMQAPDTQASGADIGASFFFTLNEPITIERQRSAMAPIINGPIEGRRLSIYSGGEHPMRGVELTNDTGLQLLAGPISVFDAGAYAGDSSIEHTVEGADRLLSFATDLDVSARTDVDGDVRVVRLRIVDGVIEQTFKRRRTARYHFENADMSRPRTILVEHDRQPGWDLIKPDAPAETTDEHLRFEIALEAGASGTLEVATERTDAQRLELTSMDMERLLSFASQGKASQDVVEAVRKAAGLKRNLDSVARQLADLKNERQEIYRDQQRIRENMSRVDSRSELYGRYMRKLSEQESRLETIEERRKTLGEERNKAQEALDSYLRDLDVD